VKKEDVQILSANNRNATRISTAKLINTSWYTNFNIIPYGLPITKYTHADNKLLIIDKPDNDSRNIIGLIKRNSKIPVTILPSNISHKDFEKELSNHSIFFHFYGDDDTYYPMLLAMSYGKTVICKETTINSMIISDTKNGYLINSLDQLTNIVNKTLIDNSSLLYTIGKNAQSTIQTQFNIYNFSGSWNSLISQEAHKTFRI
jgi:hypothetical protein